MAGRTLVAAPGLDPIRVLRAGYTLGVNSLILLVTPSARYAADEVDAAWRFLGNGPVSVQMVEVDEWSYAEIWEKVSEEVVAPALRGEFSSLEVLIGGGTKPMIAALGVAAQQIDAQVWVLDERRFELVGAEVAAGPDGPDLLAEAGANRVPLQEPDLNLGLDPLSKMYSVYRVEEPAPALPDAELLDWLRGHILGEHVGGPRPHESDGRWFEQAVMALIRAAIPDDFDAWGPQTFVLRDPDSPERPARQADGAAGRFPYRTFEVDGVVIRGTRVWAVESKYIGKKMTATMALTALAELDRRRRDLAGQTCTGVLVMLNDQVAERTPEGPSGLEPAGVEILSRQDLVVALLALDSGSPDELAGTELVRVFSAAPAN